MTAPGNPRWTVQFRIFGISVSIQPVSWLVLALLGGVMGVSDGGDLMRVVVFVVAGMLCLLVHELGHALSGRAVGAGVQGIEISGLGGATSFSNMPRGRAGYAMLVFAGPLASLLLGVVLGLAFGLQLGNAWAGVRYAVLMPWLETLPVELQRQLLVGLYTHPMPELLQHAYTTGMLVCFWWSVFNLLPIFPLDGGKLLGSLINNYFVPCVLGFLLSVGLAVWALLAGQWFNVMILGYLAFINLQYLRLFRSRRRNQS